MATHPGRDEEPPVVDWLSARAAAWALASYTGQTLTGETGLASALQPLARRVIDNLAKQGYHLVCCDNPPGVA